MNRNLKYAAALMLAMSASAHAETILNKPTFLEAAVTFLTGADCGILPNRIDEQLDVRFPSGLFGELEGAYTASSEPCVIQQRSLEQPNNLRRTFNFTNFPGPQSARLRANSTSISFRPGVLTQAKNGEGEPQPGGMITLIHESNQLMALQYIRDNFCPGMPEAPIVVNPY